MHCQLPSLDELQVRLLKLEKQNSRFRQLGVAVLIASASLIVMGQAPSKKVVEGNEFILRDDSGNVRARLSMNVPSGAAPGFPAVVQLILFDEKGKKRVAVNGGTSVNTLGFVQHEPRSGVPGLTLFDEQGRARGYFVETDAADLGPMLQLLDAQGNARVYLAEGVVKADSVTAKDAEGFAATLGVTNLVTPKTGEKHTTSAASLVLLDKDKHVVWKAP
jgi:hypothetical protein